MVVLLFLHISTMFTAVAVAGGSSILLLIATRRQDRALVAALTSLPIGRVAPPLFLLGGVFGLSTALSFGYSLVSPWLLIAYVLFALLTVLGITFSGPVAARLHAVASDPEASLDAFADVVRRFRLDAALSLGGIALIVADMVFKPFS